MLPIDKFDDHSIILPSTTSCEWGSVTAPSILQIYLHSRVYKYLSLCSQDPYQECCLVCLICPCCFCSNIALPLPDFLLSLSSSLRFTFFTIAISLWSFLFFATVWFILSVSLSIFFAGFYAHQHQ